MKERRRSPRFNPEGLEGTLKLASKAEVLNLSLTGMAIRTSAHLGAGQRCDIRLNNGRREVRLTSTVVWSHLVGLRRNRPAETGPVYEVGLELDDMLSHQAQQLLDLLRACSEVTPETRLSGRFELSEDQAADLQTSSPFLVKTLSPNGLLVETEAELELSAEVALDLPVEGNAVSARARVAYVEELPERQGKRRMGLEFVDMPDDDLDKLWMLLAAAPETAE